MHILEYSAAIKKNQLNLLEVDENLGILSDTLKEGIKPGFEEYGLTIPEFYITNIVLPENDPNFKRIRELHTIGLQQQMIQADTLVRTAKISADTTVKTAQAQSDATVKAAQREAILEEQTTETEVSRQKAERLLIQAQAEAQAKRMSGLSEAEVMKAKGYSQKDVIQADVQKAYAEGIGNMNISGSGGGIASDMLGLGIGLNAAGIMGSQISEMFQGFQPNGSQTTVEPQVSQPISTKIICPNCQSEVPAHSKFCLECGTKIELLAENEIICPSCGKKTNKGKFCMECGCSLIPKCKKCGAELPAGSKFCLECGEKV